MLYNYSMQWDYFFLISEVENLKRVILAIFANVIAFGTVFSIWKVITNKTKKNK